MVAWPSASIHSLFDLIMYSDNSTSTDWHGLEELPNVHEDDRNLEPQHANIDQCTSPARSTERSIETRCNRFKSENSHEDTSSAQFLLGVTSGRRDERLGNVSYHPEQLDSPRCLAFPTKWPTCGSLLWDSYTAPQFLESVSGVGVCRLCIRAIAPGEMSGRRPTGSPGLTIDIKVDFMA